MIVVALTVCVVMFVPARPYDCAPVAPVQLSVKEDVVVVDTFSAVGAAIAVVTAAT